MRVWPARLEGAPGGGRALGAWLGEGRGRVAMAAERGGAPSSRGRRGWSRKGAEASVSPLTHTPGEAHLACPAYVRFSRPSCPRETYLSRVCPLSFARSTQAARRGGRCRPRAGATALGPRRRNASRTSAEEAPPWVRCPAHARVTQILQKREKSELLANRFYAASINTAIKC